MLGVTVAKKGRIVFSASASSVPDMDVLHPEDTILRIYSMTKPITSVAALMLTGRVNWPNTEKCCGMWRNLDRKKVPRDLRITITAKYRVTHKSTYKSSGKIAQT